MWFRSVCLYVSANERIIQTNANIYNFEYREEKYLDILLFFRVPTDVSLQTPLKQQPGSLYLMVSDLRMTLFKITKSKN